jgi:hypothetical protein
LHVPNQAKRLREVVASGRLDDISIMWNGIWGFRPLVSEGDWKTTLVRRKKVGGWDMEGYLSEDEHEMIEQGNCGVFQILSGIDTSQGEDVGIYELFSYRCELFRRLKTRANDMESENRSV